MVAPLTPHPSLVFVCMFLHVWLRVSVRRHSRVCVRPCWEGVQFTLIPPPSLVCLCLCACVATCMHVCAQACMCVCMCARMCGHVCMHVFQ